MVATPFVGCMTYTNRLVRSGQLASCLPGKLRHFQCPGFLNMSNMQIENSRSPRSVMSSWSALFRLTALDQAPGGYDWAPIELRFTEKGVLEGRANDEKAREVCFRRDLRAAWPGSAPLHTAARSKSTTSATWAFLASTRTPAACSLPCTAAGFGPCGSTRASALLRSLTPGTSTCSGRGRLGSR